MKFVSTAFSHLFTIGLFIGLWQRGKICRHRWVQHRKYSFIILLWLVVFLAVIVVALKTDQYDISIMYCCWDLRSDWMWKDIITHAGRCFKSIYKWCVCVTYSLQLLCAVHGMGSASMAQMMITVLWNIFLNLLLYLYRHGVTTKYASHSLYDYKQNKYFHRWGYRSERMRWNVFGSMSRSRFNWLYSRTALISYSQSRLIYFTQYILLLNRTTTKPLSLSSSASSSYLNLRWMPKSVYTTSFLEKQYMKTFKTYFGFSLIFCVCIVRFTHIWQFMSVCVFVYLYYNLYVRTFFESITEWSSRVIRIYRHGF